MCSHRVQLCALIVRLASLLLDTLVLPQHVFVMLVQHGMAKAASLAPAEHRSRRCTAVAVPGSQARPEEVHEARLVDIAESLGRSFDGLSPNGSRG
jgi:hypothetical protein